MTIEHQPDLADQAAALLPSLPSPDDAFGYLAWEELVVTTALRLASRTSVATIELHAASLIHAPGGRLDGIALRHLARTVRTEDGVATARTMLARAACGAYQAPANTRPPATSARSCAHERPRLHQRPTVARRRSLSPAAH